MIAYANDAIVFAAHIKVEKLNLHLGLHAADEEDSTRSLLTGTENLIDPGVASHGHTLYDYV